MIVTKLRFHFLLPALSALMLAMGAEQAGAYSIRYLGTVYSSSVNLQSAVDSHWDSFTWTYQPGEQQLTCQNDGNTGANLGTQPFRVEPQEGDATTGTVPVRFGFSSQEIIEQVFTNFSPEVFDYHYGFGVRILNSPVPSGSETILPLSNSAGIINYFTLNVDVDTDLWFDLVLDPGVVHAIAPTFDTCLWQPQVININDPGTARTSIFGNITMVSMELVPEPSSGAMGLLGLILLGRRLAKRRACSRNS